MEEETKRLLRDYADLLTRMEEDRDAWKQRAEKSEEIISEVREKLRALLEPLE